eukprot:192838-Chlamydomonas_euryale.AAC.2
MRHKTCTLRKRAPLQVRIILNKSDQIDQQQLMRVYGALMWSLGKVFRSPEVRASKRVRGGGRAGRD